MEEIYANEEYQEYEKYENSRGPSTRQTGPRGSQRRFHKAVILCLGLLSLLLLAGIIGLCVHYQNSTRDSSAESSTNKANPNEHQLQLSSLTKQRDLLNVSLTEMTKELQRLQGLLKQKKTCPAGWRMFHCSCYFFTAQTKSWVESRQDCRARGADLVIVDSPEEQEFLTDNKNGDSWIGLTDRDNEGTWKWTDDTLLTQGYWSDNNPDNGGGDPQWGEEDCVYLKSDRKTEGNWNDLRCDSTLMWICEKMA